MSSAMTISAGIGAVASAYGASQNAKSASKALSAQQQQAQDELAFKQEQYNRYLGLMGPIEEQQSRDAQSDTPLDYDKNAAAIKANNAGALRNITSSMGMRGMAGSGTDVGAIRGAAFQQAGDLTGAYSAGLTNRRNLGLTLTGRGQIQSAANGVGQGMQNLSNIYGQQAGMYNSAANQGWNNFGQGMNGLAGILARRNPGDPSDPAMDQPTPLANANMSSDSISPINTDRTDLGFDYTQVPGMF